MTIIMFLLLVWWTVNSFAATAEPEPAPAATPPRGKPPEPPRMDRAKLEKAARDCLTASGCKFDTYYYTRNKTDLELMEIIKEYNLNK